MTTVGIIFDERLDPPFNSVSKLWNGTIRALDTHFGVRVHTVSTFDVDCQTASFRRFVDGVDTLFALSPYYTLDRRIADRPLVAYALGSLAKGGHWLTHNASSFRTSDGLIVSSTSCQHILEAVAMDPVMAVHRVPFGVDDVVYRPRDKQAMRVKHGLPLDKRVLIYSGRISPQKNCALVLQMFAALRQRYDDLHLVFVGAHDDFVVPELQVHPSDRATFDRLLAPLKDDVTLIEHQQDAESHAEILAAADIGLNFTTALGENYGYTQVEYQMTGLPVVCTDYGGLRDTVYHGLSGFRVDTTLTTGGVRVDTDQALQYTDELLADRDLLGRLARQARIHARAFTVGAFQDGLRRVVEHTLAQTVRRAPLTARVAPEMACLQALLKSTDGGARGVDNEHLHPALHFPSYRHVLSQIVSRVHPDARDGVLLHQQALPHCDTRSMGSDLFRPDGAVVS